MLQEIAGPLQELTEETPDIQDIARLIDTTVAEVFCKYPATFSPDISIGKQTEEKAPTRSMAPLVLFNVYTKDLQFVEHSQVWPN